MTFPKLSASLGALLLSSITTPVIAQPISLSAEDLIGQTPQQRTDPTNRDRDFLQPLPPLTPPPEDPNFFPDIEDLPSPDPSREDVSFPIDRIEVEGSTIFTSEDLALILDPLQGQNVTLGQLQEAVEGITQRYISEGYINSRAILPAQNLNDGIATIQVIEGSITDIELSGLDRFQVDNQEAVHLFQVIPFFDMGMVWNNPSNPDQIVNEHFLAGLGVGFLYSPVENLIMRLDLTLPLVQISDRSNNAQDDGVYFSVGYTF